MTQPNPNQPDRCPSIDPYDTLQCGRRIHDDDHCQFGGIAWKKGEPRIMTDRERADRLEGMCDRMASRLERVQAVVQRLEALDQHDGKPKDVIGWWPKSVMAIDVAKELRAAMEEK